MSEKGCEHQHHHHHHHERRRVYRGLLILLGCLIILMGLVILVVFLVLQPKKPRFVLEDVTVYAFNASSNLLTTNIQVTVSSRNPNDRIGVVYYNLRILASYRNQQFTLATLLPDTYQPHNDAAVWSPFLYGNAVPVDPSLAASLDQDRLAGTVLLNLRIKGSVKWKVGTWISARYHLFVTCPAYISLGRQTTGIGFIKFQVSHGCSVDVSSG